MNKRNAYGTVALSCLFAILALGAVAQAADYTWTGGGSSPAWVFSANWGDAGYPDGIGDTATIETAWPSSTYNGLITVYAARTIGGMTVDTTAATTSYVGINQSGGSLIFDNGGSNVVIDGSGTTDFRFNYVPITLNDSVELKANDLPRLAVYGDVSGTGGLIVTGDSADNEVYMFYYNAAGATYSYTGETRIDSGRLQMFGNAQLSSTSIVANGTWDLESQGSGWDLTSSQTLSGTGAVAMFNSTSTQYLLRTNDATIAPGDGGVGTLTITGSGLNMTGGGTYSFEVGEAASDQVVLPRLRVDDASAGTVEILDDGRTSTGTVTLFEYDEFWSASGGVDNIGLTLPTGWTASLVKNDVNGSVDLVITEIVVPEPATVTLLLFGGGMVLRRRRLQLKK